MPGLFSSNAANYLTTSSQYYLDWSRVGSLLKSGTHKYSMHELIQRGFVFTTMGLSGLYGLYSSRDESIPTKSMYALGYTFLGFVVSHVFVIAPLVYKRYKAKNETALAEHHIIDLLAQLRDDFPNQASTVYDITDSITELLTRYQNINLATDSNSNASMTVGRRCALTIKLFEKLSEQTQQLQSSGANIETALDEIKLFWENAFRASKTVEDKDLRQLTVA